MLRRDATTEGSAASAANVDQPLRGYATVTTLVWLSVGSLMQEKVAAASIEQRNAPVMKESVTIPAWHGSNASIDCAVRRGNAPG